MALLHQAPWWKSDRDEEATTFLAEGEAEWINKPREDPMPIKTPLCFAE
jgi:hypothetical protein